MAAYGRSVGYNNATGGTVTEVPNYNGTNELWRVHTFNTSGTLTVLSSSVPFRVLTVGNGGGGATGGPYYTAGGQGGRGQSLDNYVNINAGTYSVSPGSITGVQSSAGGGNGGEPYEIGGVWQNGVPGTGYGQISTDITGTSQTVGGAVGQPNGAACLIGGAGQFPGGGGGGGGGNSNDLCGAKPGGPGAGGQTIVAYRIG